MSDTKKEKPRTTAEANRRKASKMFRQWVSRAAKAVRKGRR